MRRFGELRSQPAAMMRARKEMKAARTGKPANASRGRAEARAKSVMVRVAAAQLSASLPRAAAWPLVNPGRSFEIRNLPGRHPSAVGDELPFLVITTDVMRGGRLPWVVFCEVAITRGKFVVFCSKTATRTNAHSSSRSKEVTQSLHEAQRRSQRRRSSPGGKGQPGQSFDDSFS